MLLPCTMYCNAAKGKRHNILHLQIIELSYSIRMGLNGQSRMPRTRFLLRPFLIGSESQA